VNVFHGSFVLPQKRKIETFYVSIQTLCLEIPSLHLTTQYLYFKKPLPIKNLLYVLFHGFHRC